MTDSDDLVSIRRLIQDAMPVLAVQSTRGVYPYAVASGQPLRLGRASMSTNSMVCYTLASLAGLLPDAVAAVNRDQADIESVLGGRLSECLVQGLQVMIDNISETATNGRPTQSSAASRPFTHPRHRSLGPFDSSTFGRKDPFTLTWLVELLRLATRKPDLDRSEAGQEALRITEDAAKQRVMDALDDPSKAVLIPIEKNERPVVHPLPLIRIAQLARLLGIVNESKFDKAANWFSDRLHMQLSLRGMEYGGFDPAELVFALEGLIETAPLRATRPIVNSFTTLVDTYRQADPIFRSITPFKATESGAVQLFAGVEVFASLLRSANKREQADDISFFEKIKPALHDYLQWLQANVVSGRAELPPESEDDSYPENTPLNYFGWQSEYAHTGDLSAHLWLTSQIILFLSGYEILLTRSVARSELARVGLTTERNALREPLTPDERRQQASQDDPLQLSSDSPYRVASRLDALYVQPRLDGDLSEASYSCLLYGPPGTGKTTLARHVAANLGWPLLTITTSDFIVDGEARVEARAKDVFEALNVQRDLVVFFDEIDRLVLDRDTTDYKGQGDMLQFMTPSMLTKINNLRQGEQVIFLIATNYADRIDRAIKRPGRIDERLLVLPPDLAKRQKIIEAELKAYDDPRANDGQIVRGAALASPFLAIAEIKSAVHEAVRKPGDLVQVISAVVPSISLDSYLSRLHGLNGANGADVPPELLEETYLLVYIMAEGRPPQALRDKYQENYQLLSDLWFARGQDTVRDPTVAAALTAAFSS